MNKNNTNSTGDYEKYNYIICEKKQCLDSDCPKTLIEIKNTD